MKLTSVEIHPDNSSEVMVLSFRDPQSLNPYSVKSILGLDTDEIVPRYYGANGSTKFYNLSLENRNIVIKAGLNPNFADSESFSDLRDRIYKMIASSRIGRVQLQFKNGTEVIAAIHGFFSKLETPHFEKEQTVQLTVKCDEPMLKALQPVRVNVAGLYPADSRIVDSKSTAPHGFVFDMNVDSACPAIKILDPGDLTWSFEVVPVGGFLAGDVLHFSSEYNAKEIYVLRGEAKIYLADKITLGSIWPVLFPGENRFGFLTYTMPIGLTWNTISYYPTYWGV